MEKLQKFLEEKLGPAMSVLGSNRYLLAVRDGVIGALPLIIVGSFFLIIAFPPIPQDWEIYKFLSQNAAKILLPYRMTMYIMALYAVFGMGNSLAKSFKLDGLSGAILSVMAFLLTINPVNVLKDANAGVTGFVIPMANLGSAGLFVGIISTFIAVNIYRFTQRSNFKITMPEQVPESVSRSFEALTPTLLVILLFGSITYYFGFNWNAAITTLIKPLVYACLFRCSMDSSGSLVFMVPRLLAQSRVLYGLLCLRQIPLQLPLALQELNFLRLVQSRSINGSFLLVVLVQQLDLQFCW